MAPSASPVSYTHLDVYKRQAVARAFYIAKSGRPGPVVLDFAKNAQVEMVDYEPMKLDFIRMAARLTSDDWAHGDLKPENIVVDSSGRLHLICLLYTSRCV